MENEERKAFGLRRRVIRKAFHRPRQFVEAADEFFEVALLAVAIEHCAQGGLDDRRPRGAAGFDRL